MGAGPTLEQLETDLATWQSRRLRADYTDSFVKMQAEKAECDRNIAAIEAQIGQIEEQR